MQSLFYSWMALAALAAADPRASAGARGDHSLRAAKAQSARFVCATCTGEPRMADGDVDIDALIRQLEAVHANTYIYGFGNPTNWKRFPVFLRVAREHNIDVWATLRPATEGGRSRPYDLDWETWFAEIAKLSLQHPNLVAITIDDFGYNLLGITLSPKYAKASGGFTPERVAGLRRVLDGINPELAFIPVMYYPQLAKLPHGPRVAAAYKPLLDGVLFPYRYESSGVKELKTAAPVVDEVAAVQSIWGDNFPIYLDIYASAHSTAGATTVEYIDDVLRYSARSTVVGVCLFRHNEVVTLENPVSAGKFEAFKKFFAARAAGP